MRECSSSARLPSGIGRLLIETDVLEVLCPPSNRSTLSSSVRRPLPFVGPEILLWLTSNVLAVPTDSQGILPSSLRSTLENWPAGKPKPRVLYTVPVRPHESTTFVKVLNRNKRT